MERLRSQANVEYLNEFAAHTPKGRSASAAVAPASAPASGNGEALPAGSSTVFKEIPGLK